MNTEPFSPEGDQRLAGRGRRAVGAAGAGGLAAPDAGGAAADRQGPLVRLGEGHARRPGAEKSQEPPHPRDVWQPKWALRYVYPVLSVIYSATVSIHLIKTVQYMIEYLQSFSLSICCQLSPICRHSPQHTYSCSPSPKPQSTRVSNVSTFIRAT